MATPAFAQVGSEIDQDGNGNDATVSQTATGFTDSYVTQVGDNNDADVTQSGVNNNSTIEQTTDGFIGTNTDPSNEATVTQAGTNGDSTIIQDGNNTATLTQGITGASLNDDAFILQIGANTATVDQAGLNQVTAVAQVGFGNEATVNQYGEGSGLNPATLVDDFVNEKVAGAAIAQVGFNNVATIEQSAGSAEGGSLIVQLASDNTATNTQTGDSAFSEVYQFGGSGNFANVEQGGVDADSFVVQNGSDNIARVGQVGGSSFVSQAGNGNVAHVTQGGAALPAGL